MTQSNDSDSISLRLSVKEIVKLYNIVQFMEETVSVQIEQKNGSGIGTATIIHIPPIDVTDYSSW